jgi:tetratricopeptide (TPR) repeat protein
MSEKPNSLAERISKMDMMKFRSNLKPKKRALEIEPFLSDSPELKELESDYKVLEKYQAHTAGLRCLDKILRITPGNPSVLYNKGIIFMSLKKWDRALRCFDEKIISIDNNTNTWLNRGVCLCELAASSDGPLGPITDDEYRRYNSKEMNDEEEKRFDDKLNAAMEVSFEFYEKGITSFQKAIDLDPKNAQAWTMKGIALVQYGEPEEGEDCLDKAIALDGKQGIALMWKALLALRLSLYPKAIKLCDKAIEIEPNNPFLYCIKGYSLKNSGHVNEGEKYLDKAKELGWKPQPGNVMSLPDVPGIDRV